MFVVERFNVCCGEVECLLWRGLMFVVEKFTVCCGEVECLLWRGWMFVYWYVSQPHIICMYRVSLIFAKKLNIFLVQLC